MFTITRPHPNIGSLVAQLHAAADITDTLTHDDRNKLLTAARDLTIALETPVQSLMTIAKWPVGHGALRVAMEIKLFERFDEEKKTVDELESSCRVERLLLTRIMKALCCMGIFQEDGEGCYAHNALSKPLRHDTTRVMIRGMAETTDIMPKLPDYLARLGFRNPDDRHMSLFSFAHKTNLNMYEWLQIHPDKMAIFNEYHEANARLNEGNLRVNLEYLLEANRCNIGDFENSDEKILFVDVGGGRGQLLKAFRKLMPGLKGRMIIQDLPKVIEDQTSEYGIEAMAYDFFSRQPVKGAHIYFFRFILHNWQDRACREILENTISAMTPSISRIVVNDFLLPNTKAAIFEAFNDIQMMAFAGMERTEAQWRQLLTDVGLTVQSFQYPEKGAKTPECLIEAVLEAKDSAL